MVDLFSLDGGVTGQVDRGRAAGAQRLHGRFAGDGGGVAVPGARAGAGTGDPALELAHVGGREAVLEAGRAGRRERGGGVAADDLAADVVAVARGDEAFDVDV